MLSIIAAIIAISMLTMARKRKVLGAWVYLLIALILFTVEEVIGGLKVFGIFDTPYLTHVIPSFILIFLIISLARQININRGWIE